MQRQADEVMAYQAASAPVPLATAESAWPETPIAPCLRCQINLFIVTVCKCNCE